MNLIEIPSIGLVWPDMPAGVTEIFGNAYNRTKHDLSQFAPIFHQFVSAAAEGSVATLVRTSNWNAIHKAKAGSAQARLVAYVVVPGPAGAVLRAQYDTQANFATPAYLDGATGPSVPIDAAGLNVGAWVTLATAAVADVWLRLVGLNGDGAIDVEFGAITLQYR